MCVKDKMMAHVALKRLMLGDECHAAISPDRTAIIYDITKSARSVMRSVNTPNDT